MKPTLKSKINRLLKFLGFNVVKAKRARVRKAGHRSHVPIEDANTGKTHYRGDSCPGGHAEVGLGETKQPSSDNNITGPTA